MSTSSWVLSSASWINGFGFELCSAWLVSLSVLSETKSGEFGASEEIDGLFRLFYYGTVPSTLEEAAVKLDLTEGMSRPFWFWPAC